MINLTVLLQTSFTTEKWAFGACKFEKLSLYYGAYYRFITNMPFGLFKGRPQGTEEVAGGDVVHYTCNAGSSEELQERGIKAVGNRFGVNDREVVVIPARLFEETGYQKDTIGSEGLLASLFSGRRR